MEEEDYEVSTVAKRLLETSMDLESQVISWIEQILEVKLQSTTKQSLQEQLKSGVLLCECVNKIFPGKIKRINRSTKLAFHQMENINKFLQACIAIGVPKNQLFTTTDLFEAKDMRQVLSTIAELSAVISRDLPDFDGPVILTGTGSSPAVRRKVVIKTLRAPSSPFSSKRASIGRIAPMASLEASPSIPLAQSSSSTMVLFDTILAGAAVQWIEEVLMFNYSEELEVNQEIKIESANPMEASDFQEFLKDGTKLCNVLNKINGEIIISTIHEEVGRNTFKHRENIDMYLTGCQQIGIPNANCFLTNDLIECKNLSLVVSNIHSLSKHIRKQIALGSVDWKGPLIEPITKRSQSSAISILELMESDSAFSIHQAPIHDSPVATRKKEQPNNIEELSSNNDVTKIEESENTIDKVLVEETKTELDSTQDELENLQLLAEDLDLLTDAITPEDEDISQIDTVNTLKNETIANKEKDVDTQIVEPSIELTKEIESTPELVEEENTIVDVPNDIIVKEDAKKETIEIEVDTQNIEPRIDSTKEIESKSELIVKEENIMVDVPKDVLAEEDMNISETTELPKENIINEESKTEIKIDNTIQENTVSQPKPQEISPKNIKMNQQIQATKNTRPLKKGGTPSRSWFSSVLFGSSEDVETEEIPQQPAQEQKGFMSFIGSVFTDMVTTPPQERREVEKPKQLAPVRGKLRGFMANFDRHMGSVRLQAFEMLSEEMQERIDEMDIKSNEITKKIDEIMKSTTDFNSNQLVNPPYLSERAKQQEMELGGLKEKCQNSIQNLRVCFGNEKTNNKNVVQHTNDSLHITHDKAQDILSEMASLLIELSMRTGESWLIEPMLPPEETKDIVIPDNMDKQIHQAYYACQLLDRLTEDAKSISQSFIEFTYRVGTAGKVRVVRSCNDKDVEDFGKAIDAMTSASVLKVEADLKNVLTYVSKCKKAMIPVITYLTLSKE